MPNIITSHRIRSTNASYLQCYCFPRSVSKQKPHNKNAPNAVQNDVPLQETLPPSDVMQEVSVNFSPQAGLGQNIREIRKTISLPEECSKSQNHVLQHKYSCWFSTVSLETAILINRECFHHIFSGHSPRYHSFHKVSDGSGIQTGSKYNRPCQFLCNHVARSYCDPVTRLTFLIIQSEEWASPNGWTDIWMMWVTGSLIASTIDLVIWSHLRDNAVFAEISADHCGH